MPDHYQPRDWHPEEAPFFPGSPSTPQHSKGRQLAYFVVGVIIVITGSMGNTLVRANLVNLQGTLGVYASEAAWLSASFVMCNVSMNLLLIKFRQQFGLRLFTEGFLFLYVLVTLSHLFTSTFEATIVVRGVHGIVSAALSTLGIYYMMQSVDRPYRIQVLILSIGLTMMCSQLAFVFSPSLLEVGQWRGLYFFELGLAILSIVGVFALKLPPGDHAEVYEPLDFVTFAFFAPAVALFCAVLTQGPYLWWKDTPWLGWALVASIVLGCIALCIEYNRARPLLNVPWLTSFNVLQIALVMIFSQIIQAQQSVGVVGLMRTLGMGSDQLKGLFGFIFVGTLTGVVVSIWRLNIENLMRPIIIALALMTIGAFMATDNTSLTRPQDLYFSQFLVACGAGMFIGPAMLSAFKLVLVAKENLISVTVLFTMTQNLGLLIGSSLLSTLQTMREKFHSSVLTQHIDPTNPLVAQRLQNINLALKSTIADPTLRQAQAVSQMAASVRREAYVLAYNDVFIFIGCLATLVLILLVSQSMWVKHKSRQLAALAEAQANAAANTASIPSTTQAQD